MYSCNYLAIIFVVTLPVTVLSWVQQPSHPRPPTALDWTTLNSTVNGTLKVGVPFSRPCFQYAPIPVQGSANASECLGIISQYNTDTFRAQFPGAYMNTQWESCPATGEQCELNSNDPSDSFAFSPPAQCSQGSVPNHLVEVQSPEHVRAVFAFAKAFGMKLVIKNTGHDYFGRSSGPDTIAISAFNLQKITFEPLFISDLCPSSSPSAAVTLGAGVVHKSLYDFADAMNITLPGAEDATVGAAGGYLQGGGHSALSNVFGLAVDRVLEFKIVTPEGLYLTANACQNHDLFKALRGGGGGTFGFVMEATMKALPKMPLIVMHVVFDGLAGPEVVQFLAFLASHATEYAKAGWGGYAVPNEGLTYVNPLLTIDEASKGTSDLKVLASSLNGTFSLEKAESFLSFFNKFLLPPPVPVGLPLTFVTRLVPASNYASNTQRQQLVDTLLPLIYGSQMTILAAVTPFLYPSKNDTSVTPAWRDSIWHVMIANTWSYNATTDTRRMVYRNASTLIDNLRSITPQSGSYMNEADVYEPDFTNAFWGSQYAELSRIKELYDPTHILDCWHCGEHVLRFALPGALKVTVNWKGPQDPRYRCYLSDIRP